jgi:hypothetical protein
MQVLEHFIINNQGVIRGVESMAKVGMTFSMSENSELFIELIQTFLNVFETVNEHVLTKHKRMNTEILEDKRFGPLFKVNQLIKLVQHVSMLVEMTVTRSRKYAHLKWPIILLIEVVRYVFVVVFCIVVC